MKLIENKVVNMIGTLWENDITKVVVILLITIIIAQFAYKSINSRKRHKAGLTIKDLSNGRNVVVNLNNCLSSGSYYEKMLSIDVMSEIKSIEFLPTLLLTLKRSGKTELKAKVLKNLYMFSSVEIIKYLIEYLEIDNKVLKEAARYSIERLTYEFIIPEFKD